MKNIQAVLNEKRPGEVLLNEYYQLKELSDVFKQIHALIAQIMKEKKVLEE